MANPTALEKALTEFKKNYPLVTTADLQSFVLGWKAANEAEMTAKIDSQNRKHN